MQAESLVKIMETVESQMLESTLRDDLSISEIISLYIIDRMHEPTIVEFANRIHISQSNATYLIRKLIDKGCLVKQQHPTDKREYHLVTTEKFSQSIDYIHALVPRLEEDVIPNLDTDDKTEVSDMLLHLENLNQKPAES